VLKHNHAACFERKR